MDQPVTNDSRFSRRQLLKRGAVVGGIVWATPVVQSFTSPAFAQGTPREEECEEGTTEFLGFVKWDPEFPEGQQFQELGDGRLGRGRCLSAQEQGVYCQSVSQYLAGLFNAEATVEVTTGEDGEVENVCITVPDGCIISGEFAAAKEPCRPPDFPDCDFTPDTGTQLPHTICFMKRDVQDEGDCGAVSHVELGVICCVPDGVIANCDEVE